MRKQSYSIYDEQDDKLSDGTKVVIAIFVIMWLVATFLGSVNLN
jgi:hypothetical protein